jgi:hypothetical protein
MLRAEELPLAGSPHRPGHAASLGMLRLAAMAISMTRIAQIKILWINLEGQNI